MKLNEREIKLFKDLNGSEVGRAICEYLERLRGELFNPRVITKENLEARAEAFKILEEHFTDRIRLINEEKHKDPNQFE